jgi:YQGE family putative transporter
VSQPVRRPGRRRGGWGDLAPLAAVTGLWTFGVALSAPFLDAYLWTLHASWVLLGLFNLAQYLAMVATFPVAGRLARQRGSRLPLQVAAAAVAAALILTLALGGSAPRHVVGIGLALGLGWGLYWLAQFVFSLQLTGRGRGRDRWQSLAGAIDTGSGLLAPLVTGAIAATGDWTGFRWVLVITLAALLAAAVCGRWLPANALPRTRAEPAAANPSGVWRHILQAHAALALRDGVYLFAPALLVYVTSGSALDLGAFLAATKGASLLAYGVVGRWGGPFRRRPAMLLGSALSAAAGLTLAVGLSQPLLWAFGLLTAALQPFLTVPLEACTLDVIDLLADSPAARVDRTVAKEVAVNAARVVGVAAMVGAVALLGAGAVRWWLVAVAPIPWLSWLAMRAVPVAAPRA